MERETRERLLTALLKLDTELGQVAKEIVKAGAPRSAARLIEARKAVASVAIDTLEGR